MKTISLGCKTFRDGIITAFIFLMIGGGILAFGYWGMPEIGFLPHIIIGLGGILLLMVPVILVASYVKNKNKC